VSPQVNSRINAAARNHCLPLLIYLAVAVVYTWPLVRDFSGKIIGIVPADPRHSIWLIWHFKEWLLGHDSLAYTQMLYYPTGISTLVDGVGPLSAVFALPFWHWGPVAAYNGAILTGFWLTGYCMYIAAFGLGCSRAPALAAGLIYQLLPMHIGAIDAHLEKTFLGLMPLLVLATIRALTPDRHWIWIPGAALFLVACLLYTATQFAFGLIAIAVIALALLRRSQSRGAVAKRLLLFGATSMIVTALPLVAIARVSTDQRLNIKLKSVSSFIEPDVAQFLMPSPYSAVLGGLFYTGDWDDTSRFGSNISWLRPSSSWYGSGIDTCVSIYITVAILCIIAVIKRPERAWCWMAFAGVFAVLSLGPTLRVFGSIWYGLSKPFVLPYGVLTTRVPGFGFMRAPARFMMMGAVGLAIAAAVGLEWLRQRYPGRGRLILLAALVLLFAESWPRPWNQQQPPAVSSFYARLAHDTEPYAILDLPFEWPSGALGSIYQYEQMTHHKPIACGYLSRLYREYPVESVIEFMDSGKAPTDRLTGLAADGYRYVVWHKVPLNSGNQEQLVKSTFSDRAPVFEDEFITVYEARP
jgi:hypothetical protein